MENVVGGANVGARVVRMEVVLIDLGEFRAKDGANQ